ncbi:hypothetical protein CYMTET_35617 [Cymbomonas tetramitiformis]|uniref:SGNH hydrolase-type esterase domain-containing protein n=1 Tax=Cymbomonas tetramitiformis TaxID=36881 RepID=A0AAE0F8Q6_9CHLO|nr:hypothetical protein CYMTET_35617 [Cymbomonas tetramitiformis]|eukprot:gene27-38_t
MRKLLGVMLFELFLAYADGELGTNEINGIYDNRTDRNMSSESLGVHIPETAIASWWHFINKKEKGKFVRVVAFGTSVLGVHGGCTTPVDGIKSVCDECCGFGVFSRSANVVGGGWLRRTLDNFFPGDNYELINAGMPGSSPEMITSCAENVCDLTKQIDLLVLEYGPVAREGIFATQLSEIIRSVRLFNPSCAVLFVTFEQFCSMDDAPPCLYARRCSEMRRLSRNLETMKRRCLVQLNGSRDGSFATSDHETYRPNLITERVLGEVAYRQGGARASFERYGRSLSSDHEQELSKWLSIWTEDGLHPVNAATDSKGSGNLYISAWLQEVLSRIVKVVADSASEGAIGESNFGKDSALEGRHRDKEHVEAVGACLLFDQINATQRTRRVHITSERGFRYEKHEIDSHTHAKSGLVGKKGAELSLHIDNSVPLGNDRTYNTTQLSVMYTGDTHVLSIEVTQRHGCTVKRRRVDRTMHYTGVIQRARFQISTSEECDVIVRIVATDESDDVEHSRTDSHLKIRGIAIRYSGHVDAVV